jgi:hypothetical protein
MLIYLVSIIEMCFTPHPTLSSRKHFDTHLKGAVEVKKILKQAEKRIRS